MLYTDLSGKWDAFLDENKNEHIPQNFDCEIELPNTTSNAKLGRKNTEKNLGCLTDLYKFEGYAWFKRDIHITPEQASENLMLVLERTRKTCVYVDGVKIGEYCSLCTPHRYSLTGFCEGEHELVIRVDNTNYPTAGGHLTSPDTQTNWNGITGVIALLSFGSYPKNVQVISDIKERTVAVKSQIIGNKCSKAQLRVFDDNAEYGRAAAVITDNQELECKIPLIGDVPLWSEFAANLLNLEIQLGGEVYSLKFGFREVLADGLKLKINGSETFLRGKHDGLVLPNTGFAPTDVQSWLTVFETAKSYGINHYRFHTCCPPEAAFEAADMLGMYLQPELPFWGTIPDEPDEEVEFLKQEGFRMLREFGHHPSFVMMSLGNELWGSKQLLNDLLGEYKSQFPDKLYTQGSNNFQFAPCILPNDNFFSGVRLGKNRLIRGSYATCDAPLGNIQTDEPNSMHNYDSIICPDGVPHEQSTGGDILIQYGTETMLVTAEDEAELVPDIPVISHEVGQYCIYPDYDEIEKYNGSLRHFAYENYREKAREKGLLDFSNDFFKASGALAVDCYRRDIEAALRSKKLSGFQLLDLQDFPGQGIATVGILNSFMESKGLIEPYEWRKFCSHTVVLAELPKFVYASGEHIDCGLLISNTAPDFHADKISWIVSVGKKKTACGESLLRIRNGRLIRAGNAQFAVDCSEPVTAHLEISAGDVSNRYTLYVYPDIDVEITENMIRYGDKILPIVHDIAQANESNLCIPYPDDNSLKGEYCTDFWCYGMFKQISESMGKPVPTGTLGLLIDTESELLKDFQSEYYTTPQWYNIVTHSFCADLSGTDIVPDIWVIDNPQRAARLALLYRVHNGVVCTSRLWEVSDRIEVKHFAASLARVILDESI